MALIDMSETYQMTNVGDHIDGTDVYQSNPNLLDNPFFQINQRNAGSYTANTNIYTVDRWRATTNSTGDMTITVLNKGISISKNATGYGYIVQNLSADVYKYLDGKVLTLSALFADGTVVSGSGIFTLGTALRAYEGTDINLRVYSPTTSRAEFTVDIKTANTLSIVAFKLELGSVSTLANDTPPNYAEELRKCQYYYREFSATGTAAVGIAWAYSATAASFPNIFGIDNTMRVSPTVTASGSFSVQTQGGSLIAVTSVQKASDPTNSVLNVNFMVASGLTANQPCRIIASAGAKITFSADL